MLEIGRVFEIAECRHAVTLGRFLLGTGRADCHRGKRSCAERKSVAARKVGPQTAH